MGTQKTAGFTIIEVMLFLAVTGALAVGVLVGSGVAIGQQRYRDSVSTLKSFVQQQYNEATNVVNCRTGDEACTDAVVVTPPSYVPLPQPRGTTDCLLLGRSISISGDGTQVTAANVVAYRTSDTATVPLESTDIEELKHYKLATSPIDQEVQSVAWSARVVKPKTETPQPLALLIIHSPLSGSVMTFVSESPQSDLAAFVNLGQNTTATDMCIEPSDGSFTGQQLAIRINPYATNQSAVEVVSEGEGVCS
jgi:type II secretory pathway pseudopilin PulG